MLLSTPTRYTGFAIDRASGATWNMEEDQLPTYLQVDAARDPTRTAIDRASVLQLSAGAGILLLGGALSSVSAEAGGWRRLRVSLAEDVKGVDWPRGRRQ